jgi:hypothetical protein
MSEDHNLNIYCHKNLKSHTPVPSYLEDALLSFVQFVQVNVGIFLQ